MIQTLPDEIGTLSQLSRLSLYNNRLCRLPPTFSHLKSLKELYLGSNNLRNIPKEITDLTGLETLSILFNNIEELPKDIKKLDHLKLLDLSFNSISVIPPEIEYMVNLEKIILDSNPIIYIPIEIARLTNLKSLSLFDTHLDPSISDLLSTISGRKYYGNFFTILEQKMRTDQPLTAADLHCPLLFRYHVHFEQLCDNINTPTARRIKEVLVNNTVLLPKYEIIL
jgi:hypothetical protein